MASTDLPISQTSVPVIDREYGKDELVHILRQIAESNPERVISRNFFRVNSGVPERRWTKHFGTFEQFKREAEVIISRGARKLEMDISNHVAADRYRAMGREATDWGEKYLRPSGKRWQTILIGADFHDKEADPFALSVFLDTCRRCQPDTIVLAGDLFDLPEFGRYTTDPREWDVVGRIRFVHDSILRPLREIAPSTQIDLIGGNHEFRLLKYLADQAPVMMVLLADLHGQTISTLLGLDKFQVNYVQKSDLSAWTKRDIKAEVGRNFKVYHDCFLVHHETKQGIRKQMPGVSAHSHKHLSWSFESPTWGAYEWHQLGCLHRRDATYTDAERWSTGFCLAHIDANRKRVALEYVPVGEGHAVVGGKWYFREGGRSVLEPKVSVNGLQMRRKCARCGKPVRQRGTKTKYCSSSCYWETKRERDGSNTN